MSPFTQTLTIACAVGAATAAGTFFTFSNFTINGLKRLPPARGAAAMQEINKEAPTPLFMLLLFGTGLACLVLLIQAAFNLQEPGSAYRLVAGAFYVVGVVLTTIGLEHTVVPPVVAAARHGGETSGSAHFANPVVLPGHLLDRAEVDGIPSLVQIQTPRTASSAGIASDQQAVFDVPGRVKLAARVAHHRPGIVERVLGRGP